MTTTSNPVFTLWLLLVLIICLCILGAWAWGKLLNSIEQRRLNKMRDEALSPQAVWADKQREKNREYYDAMDEEKHKATRCP